MIGEVIVSGSTHPIRRGLGVTTDGLSGAVGYAVQQAWYAAVGRKEPDRVRQRREAAQAAASEGTPAQSRNVKTTASRPTSPVSVTGSGQSAAELIRKSLLEGASTEEIVKVVRAFGRLCTSRDVAYYRHQLRAAGQLPARIARTA